MLVMCLLLVPGAEPPPEDLAKKMLPVYVKETPSQAELQIQLPATVDPASVEVLLVGREVTIVARDTKTGREVRSRTLRLDGPAIENGALAEYEGEGWLAVRLPKRTLESETD